VRRAGYRGPGEVAPRVPIVRATALDRIEAHAREAWRLDGKDPAAFVPVFTMGQLWVAGRYRALVERRAAGGVRCSGVEVRSGGSRGEFIDRWLREAEELERIRSSIGTGVSMAVRRVRPSKRGPGARPVMDRVLVDSVVLGDMALSGVLQAHGWSNKGQHIATLRAALVGVLDRMQHKGRLVTPNVG
jgi:hypothetical protein